MKHKQWERVDRVNLANISETQSIWKRNMSEAERNTIAAVMELPLAKLLTKNQVRLLQNVVYDSMSLKSIAQAEGLSLGTVRKEFKALRAVLLAALRKQLDK